MIVVLTEKPSAARNFAKALGGMNGMYEDEQYMIVNAVGHIYQFPDSPSKLAGESYKSWTWSRLPWNPDDFEWEKLLNPGMKEVAANIKKALCVADEVAISTDWDESGEGELLAWEILDALNWKGKTTRVRFVDESEREIRKAFEKRTPIKSMLKDGEYLKADTRSKFDYLSMQLTRAASLSAMDIGKRVVLRQGRLKSVMVSMVGEQLEAVNNYERKPWYTTRYRDENGHEYKRKDKDEPHEDNYTDVDLTPYKDSLVVVDKEERKNTPPPMLLDLAGLSSVLARRGYKAKSILDTYQRMYTNQIVSYPRTDDHTITPEQFKELLPLANRIAAVVGVDSTLLTHTEARTIHVKAEGSHGANRPGLNVPYSMKEIADEYGTVGAAIYDILAKNFLAILCEDYEYIHQIGHVKDYPEFVGYANLPYKQGYKAVYDSDAVSSDIEDIVNNKPLGKIASAYVYEGANPKPQNPTSNWLIGKHGKLTKYNVGTGATRTSTLAEITTANKKHPQMQLMTETKGVLDLTETGWLSYHLLNDCYIASPEVTETLFERMAKVSTFNESPDRVINSITDITIHDMECMKNNAAKLKPELVPSTPHKEKIKGTFTAGRNKGKEISFNGEWSGHVFTEDEIATMLDDKEITFIAISQKTGKEFSVKGKIKKQTYNGKGYWGFKGEFVNSFTENKDDGKYYGEFTAGKNKGKSVSFKKEWGGHTFTDEEVKLLLAGKPISFEAKSKGGKDYTAKGKLQQQSYRGKKFWGFKAEWGN